MKQPLASLMTEARNLVLSNRVSDATALIQERLAGLSGSANPPFDGLTIELEDGSRGMRPDPSPTDAVPRSRPRFAWSDASSLQPMPIRTPAPVVPSGAEFLHLQHESLAGQRQYRLYVPAGMPDEPRPLVVMLHGCTQGPDDFAVGTRMNRLADETKILVAYPQQERSANASLCWNWFESAHQQRGVGEPAILAGIVSDIVRSHLVDHTRVFAAGLSAGGVMAAVLGSTYPEIFAAIGVHSGLPQGAAGDLPSALALMRSGKASGRPTRSGARTIVFHGASDRTVHPANGERVAGLTEALPAGSERIRGTANGRSYTRTTLPRSAGTPAAEHWNVEGLGHAWSGGDAGGSYTDSAGPDASREMLRFFLDEGPTKSSR